MGGGVGGDDGGGNDGDGGGGEGDGGGGEGEGGSGDGGGGEGGMGGGGEGGKYSRGPQSLQSVPRSHCAPSAPECPSWQKPLPAYCSPPPPKALRQVFSHIIGGDPGGEESNVTVPTQLALATARAATQVSLTSSCRPRAARKSACVS